MNRRAVSLGLRGAVCLSMLVGACPLYADFGDWAHRMAITVTNYTGGTPLLDFPALVVFGTNRTDYGQFEAGAADLRFSGEGVDTNLAYEIERWDTNGTSHIWVRVPVFTNGARISAHWGKPGAVAPASTTNGAVWDSGYRGVWHLSETNGTHRDATASGPDATDFNGVIQNASGAVDGADEFDGSDDYLRISDTFNPTSYTLSAWVNVQALANRSILVRTAGNPTATWSHQLRLLSDGRLQHYTYDGATRSVTGSTTGGAGKWRHVAGVAQNGGPMRLYVDGIEEGSALTLGSLWTGGTEFRLGSNSGDSMGYFDGTIDEVRYSTAVRSAAWLRACYMIVASNEAFMSYVPMLTGAPVVDNQGGASNVAAVSALISGRLVSTGAAPATVFAYVASGTDYGTNRGDWVANGTEIVFGSPGPGILTTNVPGLSPGSAYFYTFHATNSLGQGWPDKSAAFVTGEVRLDPTQDGSEGGPTTALFTVSRPLSASACELAVRFQVIGGSATEGVDYTLQPPGGTVTIGSGSTSAVITVQVVADYDNAESNETVQVGLHPGPYVLGTATQATVVIANVAVAPPFVYVDRDATGNNDGSSWTHAFTNLQDALTSNLGTNIWVAEGTYVPGNQAAHTFDLRDNRLIGGFAGGEIDPSERQPANHPAVLSGDLGGDARAQTVVTKTSSGAAVLDGFRVRDGRRIDYWNPGGGGLRRTGGDLTVANCVFENNAATNLWVNGNGGAAYLINDGDVLFTNCLFVANVGDNGGAVWADQSALLRFADCLFSNNWARDLNYGALYKASGPLWLSGCAFASNSCRRAAGAVNTEGTAGTTTTVVNCSFIGNRATELSHAAGGALRVRRGAVVIRDSRFEGNTSADDGGAVLQTDGDLHLSGTLFSNNAAVVEGAGIHRTGSGACTISNCVFVANVASGGAGGGVLDTTSVTDMRVADSLFRSNDATRGGGIWKERGTQHVARTTFDGNISRGYGAAVAHWAMSGLPTTFEDCVFVGNRNTVNATWDAGAVIIAGGAPVFRNCGFTNNVSVSGGGGVSIGTGALDALFTNCTFVGCATAEGGGAINRSGAAGTGLWIVDCIFRDNASTNHGGAVWNAGDMTLVACRFDGNRSLSGSGGAVESSTGALGITNTVADCAFVGNTAGSSSGNNGGGGLRVSGLAAAFLEGCRFDDNASSAVHGGGFMAWDSIRVALSNCTFSGNAASQRGGAIWSRAWEALTLTDCLLASNAAAQQGGALWTEIGSGRCDMRGTRCIDNWAGGDGGGVYLVAGALTNEMARCLFAGNLATNGSSRGGGLFMESRGKTLLLSNCTLADNRAAYGGGLAVYEGLVTLDNGIVWGNVAYSNGMDVHLSSSFNTLSFQYSLMDTANVSRLYGPASHFVPGPGIFNADPLFGDPAGRDYHLKSRGGRWNDGGWVTDPVHSPGIDAGHPAGDYTLEPAPNGARLNVGAFGGTPQASRTALPAPPGSVFGLR